MSSAWAANINSFVNQQGSHPPPHLSDMATQIHIGVAGLLPRRRSGDCAVNGMAAGGAFSLLAGLRRSSSPSVGQVQPGLHPDRPSTPDAGRTYSFRASPASRKAFWIMADPTRP